MNGRMREIETLALAIIGAVPLYFTGTIGILPLVVFHLVMTGTVVSVALGRGPELIPSRVMRVLAVAYIIFYVIDAALISRSAIAASTHLILFIAAYQPTEALHRNNVAQRLLTAALIFIASLATSTHISIVAFVVLFAFLMFRQMMYVSHLETIRSISRPYALAPVSRAAGFYVIGTVMMGALLFPLLPRLRNPMVHGFAGALQNASTGLSDSIDFNESRTSNPDPAVVARVWMSRQAMPFFTPLRMRGAVYDRFEGGRWLQTQYGMRPIRRTPAGTFGLALPVGFARGATVQQRLDRSGRLYLPANSYMVSGLPQLYEGPTRESYMTSVGRTAIATFEVSMARSIEPVRAQRVAVPAYPVTPAISELARQIVGNATSQEQKARAIEQHLLRNFQYVQRPEDIGIRTMSVDDFLLKVRKGHCEYFAAGMVALLSAVDVPSRIVGGFYGGRMNPLTGYFVVRREDAHAWVDVWNGSRWATFDPTPPSLRPGNTPAGFFDSVAVAVGDSVNYFWDRYVLTFGLGDQVALFVEIFTRARDAVSAVAERSTTLFRSATSPAALGVYAGLFAIGLLLMNGFMRRRTAFDLLNRHLRLHGIEISEAMTVDEALAQHPEVASELAPMVALYQEEQFSGRVDRTRRKILRRKLA